MSDSLKVENFYFPVNESKTDHYFRELFLKFWQDIQNLGIGRYRHGGANITGFQLINESTPQVESFLKTWKTLNPRLWHGAGTSRVEVIHCEMIAREAAPCLEAYLLIW